VIYLSGRQAEDRLERKRPYSKGLAKGDIAFLESGARRSTSWRR